MANILNLWVDIHLLSPAFTSFPTVLDTYASRRIPSIHDWQALWSAWDTVTRGMTPDHELRSKPISLRNDLIFYLGHIPAFCGTSASYKLPIRA
jgi:L-histidine Nalpha-methyltransferase / hercynylcysteine S-oxide synthase